MDKERQELTKNSYLSKEEFINMINSLSFTHIEIFEANLITGFLYYNDSDSIKPVTKHIELS